MNEIIRNDLHTIITQTLSEMKAEQGKNFSLETVNLAELERRTGITRSRLRRLKANNFKDIPEVRTSSSGRRLVLSGYTDILDKMLKEGITNSSVIFKRLKQLGYTGGLTTVKTYIQKHKHLVPSKRKLVAPQGNRGNRFSTGPGEAYQMDWGFVNVLDPQGIKSRIACLAIVCHHCGKKYIEFFTNAKQENLFIGMIHAFIYMGVPETVLTDNMKSVVIKRDYEGKPIWQHDYEDFMQLVGFNTKLCKPYHPFTKGKVERLVRFVKDNFIQGRVFMDLTDLNQQAIEWCLENDQEYHKAIDCIPEDMHAMECSQIVKPLEESLEILSFLCPRRKVSFDGFIEYEGRRLGVPYTYDGRTVRVRRNTNELLIYSEDFSELLTSHPVTWSRKDSYCENQFYQIDQPEEQPTATVKSTIKQKAEPAILPQGFAKFTFLEEDEIDE